MPHVSDAALPPPLHTQAVALLHVPHVSDAALAKLQEAGDTLPRLSDGSFGWRRRALLLLRPGLLQVCECVSVCVCVCDPVGLCSQDTAGQQHGLQVLAAVEVREGDLQREREGGGGREMAVAVGGSDPRPRRQGSVGRCQGGCVNAYVAGEVCVCVCAGGGGGAGGDPGLRLHVCLRLRVCVCVCVLGGGAGGDPGLRLYACLRLCVCSVCGGEGP